MTSVEPSNISTKILVIDDDPTMVALLQTLLELEGYQVVAAVDWENLTGVALRENPDLVLMDYYLPGIDGRTVLDEFRSNPKFAHLGIIMTSGMDRSDECLDAGADAFLLKPYAPDHLLSTIRELSRTDGKQTI